MWLVSYICNLVPFMIRILIDGLIRIHKITKRISKIKSYKSKCVTASKNCLFFPPLFIPNACSSDGSHFLLFGAVSVFHKHTSTRATTFPCTTSFSIFLSLQTQNLLNNKYDLLNKKWNLCTKFLEKYVTRVWYC